METADHRVTASWGRRAAAARFRQRELELLRQGRFAEAQDLGIADIRRRFGNKYDDAIREMLRYSRANGWR